MACRGSGTKLLVATLSELAILFTTAADINGYIQQCHLFMLIRMPPMVWQWMVMVNLLTEG